MTLANEPAAVEAAASIAAPAMADSVDRLITIEIRNRGMPTGKIIPLYEAARAEAGGPPLTWAAASGLLSRVARGDKVLIVTGAGSGHLIPNGENDGPVGAAVLARTLYWGLGCTPVLVCEEHHKGPIVASCEAAGVGIRSLEHRSEEHTSELQSLRHLVCRL